MQRASPGYPEHSSARTGKSASPAPGRYRWRAPRCAARHRTGSRSSPAVSCPRRRFCLIASRTPAFFASCKGAGVAQTSINCGNRRGGRNRVAHGTNSAGLVQIDEVRRVSRTIRVEQREREQGALARPLQMRRQPCMQVTTQTAGRRRGRSSPGRRSIRSHLTRATRPRAGQEARASGKRRPECIERSCCAKARCVSQLACVEEMRAPAG